MKRVLIFSLAYYPHVGGAEVAIKEITERITDLEFHLITHRFKGEKREERVGNVHVYRVGGGTSYFSKILFIPRASKRALALNKKYRFDAIWAVMTYMLFPVVLCRFLGLRVPYALTLQEGDPFEHVFQRKRIIFFSPLLSYGFKHAAVVQAISHFLASWASSQGYTREVEVVPNGVDTAHFGRAQPRHEVRKVLDIRENETILITSSRLVRKNALDDVIRALVLLPPTTHFVILGSGREEIALKKLTHELALEERVRFLGHVPHAELPAYLHASTIFVRPSRSEGMGNSFIEAFAAGIPVIATQEGGIQDFLFDAKRDPEHPPTGFAVDKDSPEQIADAVTNIVANPENTKKVVENARALAVDRYDWSRIARDMRDRVFSRII